MTDDPQAMAKGAFQDGTAVRVVFRKTEQSQFYSTWQMWIEPSEENVTEETDQ